MQRPPSDLAREPVLVERRSATRGVVRDVAAEGGVECTLFAGCDYLGLSQHPDVRAAASDAALRLGTSVGASRETSGSSSLHRALEAALAAFLGTEAALVVEDGYIADLAVARGLTSGVGQRIVAPDVGAVLVDSDAHTSLLDAARLTGLEVRTFTGDDLTRAHALLDRHADGTVLVLTDGVFTGNGRLARTDHLLRILPPGGSLVVDDSHALGVLRERGRGTLEVYGISDQRLVITASLAKSIGAAGGMLAGSEERVERVRRGAAPYVASTALNPPSAAAALAAVGILAREPERVERLTANTGALHRMARRLGLVPRGTFLPVLRLGVDAADEAGQGIAPGATLPALQRALRVSGVFAPVIDYPGQAGAQMRLTVCSEHTSDDLAQLEALLAEHLSSLVRAT
jgi:7-keto-8-aminopelargonate synthetase-like enzyme